MKALISPNEIFNLQWVAEWVKSGEKWSPVYSVIESCTRVAEVKPEAFEVALPLHWVDCPENCKADEWFFKDGLVQPKPQNAPDPNPPITVLGRID
jgi:hypothetical protein